MSFAQIIDFASESLQTFNPIFLFHKVKCRHIPFLKIDITKLQRLVRKRIIEQFGLRDNVFDVYFFREQLFLRDISVGIQGFKAVAF